MRRGAACCAPTPQSISRWSAFASIAFHERRGVAVLRIASGVEQLLYLPGPAVVGEQRQPQLRFRIAVVTLQQIAQVAEPETQVGAAVVQLLRREPRLVQPRGARQDLGVPDRPYLALGLWVEVRLDFHEPEGERRIDPFGQGDVVHRRGQVGRDAVVRRVVDDRVCALELQPGDRQLAPGRLERLLERTQLTDQRRRRESTRLNSSHVRISYAVFCLKKKKQATAEVRVGTCTCPWSTCTRAVSHT